MKTPVSTVTAVAAGLLVAGCSITHMWIYDKAGMTPESLDRDRAFCRAQAPAQGLTRLLALDDVDRDGFTRCMQQRGYTARREPF